jgi:lipoate---protein ligase
LISLFQHQFAAPAENLAADEVLLDLCDDDAEHPGFLRFYECRDYFVVLGYGKHLEREVNCDECERLGIPVLRRCSGGGTVLQGPGCFNYTLVLPIGSRPELATITGANCFIMQRIRRTIGAVSVRAIEVRGITDLVHADKKFSGNAQRRKRRALLFHGCFLIDFNLPLISQTLRTPEQQPEYRARRSHADFLTNLPLDRAHLRQRFQADWNATESTEPAKIISLTAELAKQKYFRPDWTERH